MTQATTMKPCPICGKPAILKQLPFCSPRCRQVDLGRWFKEGYRVETAEGPADGEVDEDR